MSDGPSFQDLLGEFSDEVFVGRGEQLAMFEKIFKESRPPFLILGISGQGGVGKSTLLRQYQHLAENNHAFSALVNEDHTSIPIVLAQLSKQLEDQGLPFKEFNDHYKRYRELKEQVEADPKAPSGIFEFALRSATKIGLRSLRRIPVVGDIKDVLITPETEDALAEQSIAFAHYISQKFNDKDDKALILETDSELSKCFLSDLNAISDSSKVILSFDTFEKTASIIENWLIDLLCGNYGTFRGNTIFVIAGRYPLGQAWMEFRKAIRQIELQEFTEEEAKEYLLRSEITDEKQISQIIEISNRLPILLALLASSPSSLPEEVSGDAVERFLHGKSDEQREAALISSVPRYFNLDILSAILGKNGGEKAFDWLSVEHFVYSSERGWIYHDVVRTLILRYFHLRSSQACIDAHRKMVLYYESLQKELGVSKENCYKNNLWRKYEIERIYHYISQNPTKLCVYPVHLLLDGLLDFLKDFPENKLWDKELMNGFSNLMDNIEGILDQLAGEYPSINLRDFIDKYKKSVNCLGSDNEQNEQDIAEAILWIKDIDGLDDKQRSVVHILPLIAETKITNKGEMNNLININRAIELNPEMTIYYLFRSIVEFELNDYSAALTDCSKAIDLKPENVNNYYWRGRTYYEMKDYPAALTDFTKAIELQPEDGNNYYWSGVTYYTMGDYPAALADFTKAIELQPEDGNNYYWRGFTYYEMKDYPAALTDFTKAIELQPEDGNNNFLRGRTYYTMGDYPAALTDFTKAIELQPEDGNNYYWRGRTYYEMKDYPAALADFTKAIELQPEDGYNYFSRARTYFTMKDYPAALADFTKAIELQPEDGNYYYWRGRTYFKMQTYSDAKTDLTTSVEFGPHHNRRHYFRGLCNYALGEMSAYKEDISSAIQFLESENEKSLDDNCALALYYVASNNNKKARVLYQEVIVDCENTTILEKCLNDLEELLGLISAKKEAKKLLEELDKALSTARKN